MSNQKELNKIYGEVNFMITNASKKELFDYIVGLEIQNKKYKEVIDKLNKLEGIRSLTMYFEDGREISVLSYKEILDILKEVE